MTYKNVIFTTIVLCIIGCQDLSSASKGRIAGNIVGGLIGNKISNGSSLGTITGSIVGGFMGESIAERIHSQQVKISHVLETSKSEVATAWSDKNEEIRYIIVPERSLKQGSQICRPFKIILESREGREVKHGLACRKNKDIWLIKN